MAKKKAVRKSKKKPAQQSKQSKKKAAPASKSARSKKAGPKKKPSPRKAPGTGMTVEIAEIDVIGEPEDVADDEVFPPDYGGSE
jgi:hypothetical protein